MSQFGPSGGFWNEFQKSYTMCYKSSHNLAPPPSLIVKLGKLCFHCYLTLYPIMFHCILCTIWTPFLWDIRNDFQVLILNFVYSLWNPFTLLCALVHWFSSYRYTPYIFMHLYLCFLEDKKNKEEILQTYNDLLFFIPAGQSEGKNEGCACPSSQIWWDLWETACKWPGHHLHVGYSALPHPWGQEIPHDAVKQEDSQPSDLPAAQSVPVGRVTLGLNLPWVWARRGLLLVSQWLPKKSGIVHQWMAY